MKRKMIKTIENHINLYCCQCGRRGPCKKPCEEICKLFDHIEDIKKISI